jgi:endonuclease/exonuclease/phosphatase family metal-dependent hydrolase
VIVQRAKVQNGFRVRQCRLRLLLVLLLTALPACTGPREAARASAQATTLPVMSFNIRYGTATDGEHAWPLRRSLTFRVIREQDPAVLGVQEALRFQLDEIGAAQPHFGEVGVGRTDGVEEGEYAAILYDRNRLDVLDQGTFWLSDTPEVPNSMSWGNRITRIATWARFRDSTTGATFLVFNTHWDHESQSARERSARLLMERIGADRAAGEPVLVMGDFNAGEDNIAFRVLLADDEPGGVRLYDTFRAAHPRALDTGTYHAFAGDRSGAKIDAILASPEWRTLDAGIILFSENGLYPSDHFPVTATVELMVRRRAR